TGLRNQRKLFDDVPVQMRALHLLPGNEIQRERGHVGQEEWRPFVIGGCARVCRLEHERERIPRCGLRNDGCYECACVSGPSNIPECDRPAGMRVQLLRACGYPVLGRGEERRILLLRSEERRVGKEWRCRWWRCG